VDGREGLQQDLPKIFAKNMHPPFSLFLILLQGEPAKKRGGNVAVVDALGRPVREDGAEMVNKMERW
jgi:hypothetical protein